MGMEMARRKVKRKIGKVVHVPLAFVDDETRQRLDWILRCMEGDRQEVGVDRATEFSTQYGRTYYKYYVEMRDR